MRPALKGAEALSVRFTEGMPVPILATPQLMGRIYGRDIFALIEKVIEV